MMMSEGKKTVLAAGEADGTSALPDSAASEADGTSALPALAAVSIILLVGVLGFVFLLLKITTSPLKKPIGYWIAKDYNSQIPQPEIVLIADSQLGGLRSADAKVFGNKLDFVFAHRSYALEKALKTSGGEDAKVFIASQPGTVVSDCFVITRGLFSAKNKPNLVILALNPRSFLKNGLSCPGDSDYFRYFAPHAALTDSELQLAYPKFWNRPIIAFKDLLGIRYTKVVPGEFQFLTNDQQTYHDLQPLYPPNFTFDVKQCAHQIRFLDLTLQSLRRNKIESLVIAMPMIRTKSVESLAQLSSKLKKPMENSCASNDARFLDLTEDKRFSQNDFLDPIHLSQKGGESFANILSQYITEMRARDTLESRTIE